MTELTEDEKMMERWLNHLQDEDSTGAWNDDDTRTYGKILQALSLEKRVRGRIKELESMEPKTVVYYVLQELLGEQL